ncbi:hypothetical protein GCM10009736_06420 [Actinomadura bangladeshensis]
MAEQPVDGFARVVHGAVHAGQFRYISKGIGHGPTLCGPHEHSRNAPQKRRTEAVPG